jgi:hypothetical protein
MEETITLNKQSIPIVNNEFQYSFTTENSGTLANSQTNMEFSGTFASPTEFKGILQLPEGPVTIRASAPYQTPLPPTDATSSGYVIPNNPFILLGVWKTDDMRAPDNSWSFPYSIYMKFTNTTQYVYHGIESFNNNKPMDEADLVYIDNNNSIFIKKLVYIPDHPEYLGKYQKWTWRLSNGNVLFTIYGIVDSQDLALSDTNVTGLATGVKVP